LHSPIQWTVVAPGVWKGIVGKPEAYNLLTASGSKPNTPGLEKLSAGSFPFLQTDIAGSARDGKTFLRFPLDEEEQLYGFGLNFQTVHQRWKNFRIAC
jgi:alpha-D-xyloside xylohydrolase